MKQNLKPCAYKQSEQAPGPVTALVVRAIRWIGHLPGLKGWSQRFLAAHAESLHKVDEQIAALHQQSRRNFYVALLLEYLARVVQSAEVLFMLLLFGIDGGGGIDGIMLTYMHSILCFVKGL